RKLGLLELTEPDSIRGRRRVFDAIHPRDGARARVVGGLPPVVLGGVSVRRSNGANGGKDRQHNPLRFASHGPSLVGASRFVSPHHAGLPPSRSPAPFKPFGSIRAG